MPKNKGWFRLYDRMIDSPQILELNDSEFRLIVSMWCLASSEASNGIIPYTNAAIRRRIMPDCDIGQVDQMLLHLLALDLLLGTEGSYKIPRWEEHQYEYNSRKPGNRSDYKKKTETNGQLSENNRKENGKTETDTDTETDSDNKNICAPDGSALKVTSPAENSLFTQSEINEGAQVEANAEPGKGQDYPADFESFWDAYPRKKEKQAAFACWKARKKEGYQPQDLVMAARAYSLDCKKAGTEESYIKQAKTFLGPKKPFLDYMPGTYGKVVNINESSSSHRPYRG